MRQDLRMKTDALTEANIEKANSPVKIKTNAKQVDGLFLVGGGSNSKEA